MSAQTDSLIAGAACIQPCIPGDDMKLAVLISLFAKIAGVSADTNSLMDGAKCIEYCIPGTDMKLAVLISLASQIVSGGGTGGGVTAGAGVPTTAPASGAGIYIQTDSVPPGLLWEYFGGAWH